MLKWLQRRARSTDVAAAEAASRANLRCSFCKKKEDAVNKLIAGPDVFICDDCVAVCVDILAEDSRFERLRGRVPQGASESPSPDTAACSLCGRTAPILEMLLIKSRGGLCGDCAGAVEDALAQGRPAKGQDQR